jgi:hypothetical protein
MNDKYSKYANNLAFLDTLFNLLMAFSFLFLASFLLMNEPKKKTPEGVKLSAEFIITMTWDDESLDDIDLFMLTPNNKQVFFATKDVEYVTLDRDDRGAYGDISTNQKTGERELLKLNKEMMTIRAIRSGRYVVNAFLYSTFKQIENFSTSTALPLKIKMTLTKLNPLVKEISSVEFLLTKVGEQRTAFIFEIDADGNIKNLVTDENEPFVSSAPGGIDSYLDSNGIAQVRE